MTFTREQNRILNKTNNDPVIRGAASRAYGMLWRDPSGSALSRGARKELFDALSPEERRDGITYAVEMFGPMTDAEMIAADIRVGVFPNKSTEVQEPRTAAGSLD
jgi:hypothetical protein